MTMVCPTCGMKISDKDTVRCPRCHTLVRKIAKCENCRGCSLKGVCSK